MEDSYNLSRAEFVMVHSSIDRMLDLHERREVIISIKQLRNLRNIRQKPDYLTKAQKNLVMAIYNALLLRHRDLFSIMTPNQKKKKDKAPGIQEFKHQLIAVNRSMICALQELGNSKQ